MLPATVGMVVAGSFGVVDTFFVGQVTGKVGLAATALMWPVGMVLVAFGVIAATVFGVVALLVVVVSSGALPLLLGLDGVWLATD